MRPGDILLCTFEGDTENPPVTYPAEITFVDLVGATFDCRLIDTGLVLAVTYLRDQSGPWTATGDDGNDYVLATHDIYEVEDTGPGLDDVGLLTMPDGSRYLGYVEMIDPILTVQLYHHPYPRVSLDFDTISASDWTRYGVGDTITSLQRCSINNELPAEHVMGIFSDGWWSLAARRPAHPGRVGGAIAPFATVVHTTDMPVESLDGLIYRWQNEKGKENGAHFVIGRTEDEGVVQLVPITRNGNHVKYGHFVVGEVEHSPNTVSVGIEIHCAGEVHLIDGRWRWLDEHGEPSGTSIPESDVIRDPSSPVLAWHVVTDYQYEQLGALLDGLDAALDPLPEGCVAVASHPVPAFGRFATGREVGHVSLSPQSRSDPWPPTCDWMRAR